MFNGPKSLAWQVQVQRGKEGSPWEWSLLPSSCPSPGGIKPKVKTEGKGAAVTPELSEARAASAGGQPGVGLD